MIRHLLHEDAELKRYVQTPKDQKPQFEWSALAAVSGEGNPSRIKVRVGEDERDFDVGEIADTVGGAITDLLLARQREKEIYTDENRRLVKVISRAVTSDLAARAARPDYDDVLLWNERGELTETTTANIVLELDGVLATPPVTCGLLPGTLRASLLRRDPLTPTPNGLPLQERTLTPADLNRCQAIYLINSVRRWRPARLLS